jgi:hypothetical protein
VNKRDRRVQERRREWNQSWTRTWKPWAETFRHLEPLTLQVKASGVEALDPPKLDVAIYSAASVPFHACGNPDCSIGGIDLRPLVHHAMAEHRTTFHSVEACKGRDDGRPRSCPRSVEVSGSITYKPG